MSIEPVEMTGTLRPDGVVVLDGPVAVPPGRVKVTVQAVAEAPKSGSLLERMQVIWDAQDARGYVPRSAEEVDAELRESRDGDDVREPMMERIREECRLAREAAREGQQ